MKRRDVLWTAAALALARPAIAAPRLIGVLSPNTKAIADPSIRQLVEQLAKRGWRLGIDIAMEERFGDQQADRLPALAREVVALKPDLIVAYNNLAVIALKNETRSIPIVMVSSSNPAADGIVASMGRPGGNITGTMWNPLEIAGKAVEELKAAVPRISRITLVWNPDAPGMSSYKPYADRAAEQLKVALTYIGVRKPEDFRRNVILATRPEALYVVWDPVLVPVIPDLVHFAIEHRLPSISFTPQFTDAGGLISMSPALGELASNVAEQVDSILRGANPATLPVRVPSHVNVTLNLKTARAIGLQIPKELLLQASDLIE